MRRKIPKELRDRAVRLVFEHEDDYSSQWAAIRAVSEQVGCGEETLRRWVRQAETDAGNRPGTTTEEKDRIRELERENQELRRTNEILKAASVFFAAELDRPSKK